MSLSHSPQIVTNGLAFYYDMANTKKSWRGAPTINLVNPSWAAWSTDGSGQGSIGTRTITSTYECLISDIAANTRQNAYVPGVAPSTTYTFSVEYKKVVGTPTLRFQLQAYNGASYISSLGFPTTAQLGLLDIEEWQTAKFTVTTPANTTQILWFMQDGDDYTTYTHSFMLANTQCEQGSFATPFVVGTRSNSQAILDLTGTDTITANSLTYASDNTFSFGGSDYLTVPNGMNRLVGTNSVTFSAWIYRTSAPNQWSGIIANKVNTENGISLLVNPSSNIFWQYDGGTSGVYAISGGTTLALNTWYNIVGVYDNVGLKTYLNGVLNESASDAGKSISSSGNMDITIGAQPGPASNFPGKISSAQIYNRALSAAEVRQNFNAQRGLYSI